MNIIIDMGTSNMRIYLVRFDKTVDSITYSGAREALNVSKAELYKTVNGLINALLLRNGINEKIEGIYVYGMGGSELGISYVPHIDLPVNINKLAQSITETEIPTLFDAPVYTVPGVKKEDNTSKLVMRGEETEVFGIINDEIKDCTIVLPGSHCKSVKVDGFGTVTDFASTLTGEMLQALSEDTILKNSVRLGYEIDNVFLIKGANATKNIGINTALFKIRAMALTGSYSEAQLTSFFIGAVLYEDVLSILSFSKNDKIFVCGKKSLRDVYCVLLELFGENSVVNVDGAENLGLIGIQKLIKKREEEAYKQNVIEQIKKHKIITIMRGLNKEEYLPTVKALYEGGVRLVEVTFDATNAQTDEETAEIIKLLSKEFKGRMIIGAGSVLHPSQVRLTKESGGAYIISPNFDKSVVSETNRLSLVSIPGCFSPTEIVNAYDFGADFVKVFPDDVGGDKLIKAIHAPLKHIPLLAVGGVNEDNVESLMSAGAVGVGIGSTLANKELISNGEFDKITEIAEKCVSRISKY